MLPEKKTHFHECYPRFNPIFMNATPVLALSFELPLVYFFCKRRDRVGRVDSPAATV